MRIRLSDHFSYGRLLRFTLPSILMLVFTSIYSVVDGFFVSNFAGKTPFSAVNFIMPFLMILGACGFLFGTGGCALLSKMMGEGKAEQANSLFSLIVYTSAVCGVVLGVLGWIFLRPLMSALGAEGALLENCIIYGRIILPAIPAYVLQYEFQCLFAAAGKPGLGLGVTLAAGITNMVLDAVFVAGLSLGLKGAAAATALSQCIGGFLPLIYFSRPNHSLLRLGRAEWDGKALVKVCTNGSSELMSNLSMSVVGMLYNVQLLSYAGQDGVAAYGVLMYVSMIFQSIFLGYSVGTAPVIGYHYGAQNRQETGGLLRKGLVLIGAFAAVMFGSAFLLGEPLARMFTGYDQDLLEMTARAFSIFSFSFLFSGYVIFGSSFFTALNDGLVSAAISFLRTMVFQVAAVLILPVFWGVDGIWLSVTAAELAAAVVTALLLKRNQKKYGY